MTAEPGPGNAMIAAQGLARSFRSRGTTVEAVRGVDLNVEHGELVGFLGPNGAGKTTTLRMLTTLLRPTAGSAQVAGRDLRSEPIEVRKRIGYVAQAGSTVTGTRVGDELIMHGRMYGLSKATAAQRAAELSEQLDLRGLDKRQVQTLSGGQRRRLDIAMGLVHDPRLVFLDEPTTGLDPQSRANLWQHIRGLNAERGTTVFLTTHYLEEADALCDRLMVIDNGSIVAEGAPEELKRQVSGDSVSFEVAASVETDAAGEAAAVAGRLPGAEQVTTSGLEVRLRVPRGDTALPTLLRELDATGIAMTSMQVHRPTLDDVFLTLTGRSLRDEETTGGAESPEATTSADQGSGVGEPGTTSKEDEYVA